MDTLLALKLLHVLSMTVYLGNLTAACLWSRFAAGLRAPAALAAVLEGIDRNDRRLTVPGAAALIASGLGLVAVTGRSFVSHWIVTAIALAALIFWLLRFSAAPLKRALLAEARAAAGRDASAIADGAPPRGEALGGATAERFGRWQRRLDLAWLLSLLTLLLMFWRPD